MKAKSKLDLTSSPNPAGLTFSWQRGDEIRIRFLFSFLLACGLFVGAWFAIRIVVPVAMAPDSSRVGKAQLILVNEESHPTLRRLLADRSLPSLGVVESVGDVPLVEDMLALLSLEKEVESRIELYPTPEVITESSWPETVDAGMSLPRLSEVDEKSWPKFAAQEPHKWVVRLSGQGELKEGVHERVLPWRQSVPFTRQSQWSLVFDEDGVLAFAAPLGNPTAEVRAELRELLQKSFEEEPLSSSKLSGTVELEFLREGD